jgi:hypothetical protein
MNELTGATAIAIDYSTVAGTPVWTTSGLASSALALTAGFQLFNVDFTPIAAVGNNVNFKVRLRFTGTNMTADAGNRITFNNIAVHGTALPLAVASNEGPKFTVFPNPTADVINVVGFNESKTMAYELYTIEGKRIKSGHCKMRRYICLNCQKEFTYCNSPQTGKQRLKRCSKNKQFNPIFEGDGSNTISFFVPNRKFRNRRFIE